MDKYIPLSVPSFEGNEQKYVNDAVQQGWVSTGGAYVKEFEKNWQSICTQMTLRYVKAVQQLCIFH